MNKFIEIEQAAIAGAYGNGCEPTDGQKIAGNYKKGRFDYFGVPVVIEQPRHSYRTGVDRDGRRWSSRMAAHYGYIAGTKGADGDEVDVFVGYYPQSKRVYIINQKNKQGGFDEHKVMLAFPDEDSAISAYKRSFEQGADGLGVVVDCSINQLLWWLKNADLSRPVFKDRLPFEDFENMKRVKWGDDPVEPIGVSLDHLLYEVRRNDEGGLLMDSITSDEILEDSEGSMVLDALVVPYARLERQMNIMRRIMERTSGNVKPEAMQITAPFRQHGTANVAVIFELTDGQTVTIFFHNPEISPKSVRPQDELVSWKWVLNKKDITIVVAPERGQDINVRMVARRVMALAEKNSAAFQRANQRRAERMQKISGLKAEIEDLEKQLKVASKDLELAKANAEERKAQAEQAAKEAAAAEAESTEQAENAPAVTQENLTPAFNVGDKLSWINANGEMQVEYRGPLDANTSVVMADGMQMNAPTSELRLFEQAVEQEPSANNEPPSIDDILESISKQGSLEMFAVKRWFDRYGEEGARLLEGAGYGKRAVFSIVFNSIKPHKELMDAVNVDVTLTTYYEASAQAVKALSLSAFNALLASDEEDAGEKTREMAYMVLRYSNKKSDHDYVSKVGRMRNHARRASQAVGGKLYKMANGINTDEPKEQTLVAEQPETAPEQEAQQEDSELKPEGVENKVKTAKGTQISTGFTVVEANALIASHDIGGRENPDYPQELQPRDRSRFSSVAWVKKTAANLDPDSLGRTSRADSGAPIIGPDRIVESGNGRVMAIMEAYRTGQAGEYREWLTQESEFFGLSKEKIEGMKAPVLVRVRTQSIDRAVFAVEANQDDKLAMTATEKAKSDANRLDDYAISLMGESGDLTASENLPFLQAFLKSIGETEAAQYITSEGKPTASLIARVQAAIFAKAYEDERLLEITADSARPEIANIINALNSAAPEFIKARAANPDATNGAATQVTNSIELSLDEEAVQAVIGAINLVKKARDSGTDVNEVVNQLGLFEDVDPNVGAMAVFISQNNRSAKRLSVAFKAIAEFIRSSTEHKQTVDMFGDTAEATLKDVIDAANRALSREYGEGQFEIENLGLFNQPEPDPEPAPEPEQASNPQTGPEIEPQAEPETAAANEGENVTQEEDKQLLQSIVDGSIADILSPALAETLGQVYMRNQGNEEMEGLFMQAATAYEQAMLKSTDEIGKTTN